MMKPDSIFSGWLILAAVAAVLLGGAAWFVITSAEQSRADIDIYGNVPDFEFRAHTGEKFGSENLKGSISVIDIIFTSCRAACPIMTPNMAALYRAFEESDIVRFVSISCDPEVDTLPVLQEYARTYGVADGRWKFLRTDIENVVELSEKGFMLSASGLPMGHSTKFILVDENLQIRGYYDGLSSDSIDILKEHIAILAKKPQ
ncbi:SCO family protein [candidate division KSB1 bacterium]